MNLEILHVIEEIIAKIEPGCTFDTHFVIERFFKSNKDNANLYLKFCDERKIENWHSSFSKAIGSLSNIEKMPYKNFSIDLLGNNCKNQLWKKLH